MYIDRCQLTISEMHTYIGMFGRYLCFCQSWNVIDLNINKTYNSGIR